MWTNLRASCQPSNVFSVSRNRPTFKFPPFYPPNQARFGLHLLGFLASLANLTELDSSFIIGLRSRRSQKKMPASVQRNKEDIVI